MAGNPTDQIAQMESQVAKFEQISQRFSDYVQQGGQKFADSAKAMAAVYEKIAAEQSNSVELMKEMSDLQDEMKAKAKELAKLKASDSEEDKKKAAALTKELATLRRENEEKKKGLELSQKEIKAVQEQVKELAKVKTSVDELGKKISETTKGWAQHLTSADALINGFKGIAKAAQDFVDIQILSGSYGSMTGDIVSDLKTAIPAMESLAKNTAEAQVSLAKFGYSAEESGAAFKRFANLTADADRMKHMTEATGALAKMLGVSLNDSIDFVEEQQLKYNQTAEQSAAVLMNVRKQTEQYNSAAGTQVMRGRDVVKVMFDISREGKMIAQDQQALEKMITSNLIKLQSQGQNYKEALDSASGYVKKMTTEAPEWTKILSGRELLQQMDKLGDLTAAGAQDQTKEMIEQLDAASPGLAKRVEELRKKIRTGAIDRYSGERMMQEMLQGTSVGMKAMQDQFANVAKQGVQAVKAVYGVSEMEAQRMIDQNEAAMKVTKDLEAMQDPAKAEDLFDEYELTGEEIVALKSKSLTMTEKEGILKKKQDEMNLAAIEEQEAANKEAKEDQILAARAALEEAKKGGNKVEIAAKQESLLKLEGSPLQSVTDQLGKTAAATQQLLGGGLFTQIKTALGTPMGQQVTAVASLGKGVYDFMKRREELKTLKEIAANTKKGNTKKGGAGGGGGGSDIMDKGVGIINKLAKSGKFGKLSGVIGKATDIAGKFGLGEVEAAGESVAGAAGKSGGMLSKLAGAAKFAKFAKFLGPALTIGAGAMSTYSEYSEAGTAKEKKAALIKGGAGTGGALAGAVIGGALGSVVPVVGTAIGAALGGLLGEKGGRMIAEHFTNKAPEGSVTETPVSAPPQQAGPPGGGVGGEGSGGAGASGGITQTARIVPGSQGNNIAITTILPVAQVQAQNMSLIQSMSN